MEKNLKFKKSTFYIVLILTIIGIALCCELSYIFYKTNFLPTFAKSFCATSELIDCDGVAQTSYSMAMGVPNALWGLILYLVILMLLFVDRIQSKFPSSIFNVFKNPQSYIATLSLLAFAISILLAFISIYEIKKICVLCFVTYFINLFIAIAANTKNFFIHDIKTTIIDFIDGAKKHFILFLIVLIGFSSTLYYLNDSMILSPKQRQNKQYKEFFQAKTNKYAIKGNILGNKNSKVVINVYSDYNCPFCKIVNIMLHKLAKEKDVLINEINFPLDTTCNKKIGATLIGHESSCLQSRYAIAAKEQGKFWGAANALFTKQPTTEEAIIKELKHLKLDEEKLKKDAWSNKTTEELLNDINTTNSKGISGTPALEINGVLYMGAMPYDVLKEFVDVAKKRAENNDKQ
ncbi:MAG: thioredoxin domain-containing protein [Candidatus Gastranaerophilales bacterium]|nr:thioredoxin domain-containing protein [Candidatus Gastranaerophilales bacterium]